MAKVAEYKKKVVKNIINLISQYPITAAINMENLPAPQLQKMRAELRGKVEMAMTKRRIIKIAFEEAKKSKKGIEKLGQHLEGMPALMFSKENPFKLYRMLQKSKSPAPAKANQTAPKDIVIPAGPTPFAPGPIIGELAQAGIKAGVEGGKVAIKEDSVVVEKGGKIKPKVAEILTRLGIEPMEVGLDLIAAYEEGTIYTKDVLAVDETEFMNKLQSAASGAFNVAMFVSYPTKNTIEQLISKASNDAKALGVSQNIIDKEMIDVLLGRAEVSMMGLKSAANIEVKEKPIEKKEEVKKEPEKPKVEEKPITKEPILEKPIEKIKEKPKEEIKPEPKKEEPIREKPITKKPIEKIKPIEKKEIKILEEEKKIIEEEKKLEKEKPAETPVEKEVQKALKEEEEKQLEKERIEKEKELEKIEKQKAEARKAEAKKAEEDETAKKVAEMVAKTKKFGKEPTAEQLVQEVKEEAEVEEAIKKEEPKKKPKKEEIPSLQELAERKKKQEKKDELESAARLLEKLKKRGTLRE